MTEKSLESIILDYIHTETGWGNPLQPGCEFEDLKIVKINELSRDVKEVIVEYWFDEDGFSQYDKTHELKGRFEVSSDGEIIKAELEETFTGPATTQKPYKSSAASDSAE